MKLRWTPCVSTSALHAAHAIACNQMVTDRRIVPAIHELAQSLQTFCLRLPSTARRYFWNELLYWSVELEINRELADRVLTRLLGKEGVKTSQVTILAGLITDLEAAYGILFPKLQDQLILRSRPLQEMWSGFGNGLLAHLGRLTERGLLIDHAEVVIVQPVLGGAGEVMLGTHRILIEALLANAIPELPEVVRLTWLVAQLKGSQQEAEIPEDRYSRINALAMLPPVLAAGQIVDLARIDEANLALAIEQWQIPVPPNPQFVASLLTWWETYLQTRPTWPVALKALDRMVQSTQAA